MLKKGQFKRLDGGDAVGQAKFVESLFGVAAWSSTIGCPTLPQSNLCNASAYRDAPAALFNCAMSRDGGAPNNRLYSRLNCEGLS